MAFTNILKDNSFKEWRDSTNVVGAQADASKSITDFITITQAVNLDTLESDIVSAKTITDFITITQAVNLDQLEIDVAASKSLTDFITVSQPVNLDTIESDTNTNNSKVSNATHTGDVIGATVLSIANNAITTLKILDSNVSNVKLANMDQNLIKGRATVGAGAPEDLSAAQIRTIINVGDGATITDAANVSSAGAVMDTDFTAPDGFMLKTGAGTYSIVKINFTAISPPGATDDSASGYTEGSTWVDETNDDYFVCLDATPTAAIWVLTATVTGGNVTSVAGAAPITSTGGNSPTIGITAATTTARGSMAAADKQKADYTTIVSAVDLNNVSNANLANQVQATIKGRASGAGTGAVTDLTATQIRTIINVENGADVTDATNVNAAGAVMNTDTSTAAMLFVIDEDTMVSNLSTRVPTQQSVKAYVDNSIASSVTYQGEYNASTNTPNLDSAPVGVTTGDMYTVTVAGNFFTTAVEIGDVVIAEQNDPTLVTHWTIVNKDLNAASIKSSYESNADTEAYTTAEQSKVALLSGTNTGDEPNSSTTVRGIVELATTTEVNTGTDTIRAITPSGLANSTLAANVTTNNAKVSNATHTGEVTGSTALTIANSVVTNAKMANMAGNTIKGRSSTTGVPTDLSATAVRTLINVENGATADQTDAQIKTAYENNLNTNAFTDANVTTLGNQSGTNTGDEPNASSVLRGIVELATTTEVNTGTDTVRAITPSGLANSTLAANVTTNNAKVSNVTHTGEVTGSTALTIASNAVSNTKLSDMVQATVKGRASGAGTGDPSDLTATQLRTIINVENGATADLDAGEILTLLKTVDGAGSGLSADLLDGYSSGDLLKLDGTFNTKTGGALLFNDGVYFRLGTGGDVEHYFDGANYYTDINNGTSWIIRDGNSANATRYTFDVDNGTFTASGNIVAYSDRSLKENIDIITNPIEKIMSVNGYTFDRKDIDTDRQTGVIAQEIQKILPEAVTETDGILGVSYGNMAGLFIEAFKEHQTTILELKNRITELETK